MSSSPMERRVTKVAQPVEPSRPTAERRWSSFRRFTRNSPAVVASVALILLALAAIFAPWITTVDPTAQDLSQALKPPSREQWCGTDQLGRDICARLIHGTRTSLSIGFLSVLIGTIGGTTLGLIAGYRGGWTDNLIMRAMDVMFALPAILLAIVIVTALGPSLENAMLAIAIIRIPSTARLVRAVVLTIMPKEYILACRVIGVRAHNIVLRHVLPNSLAPLIVESTIGLAFAILSIAGLGFLGLGAQPPTPEWGAMISESRNFLYSAFHVSLFPGLMILLTTISLNLMGDGLQDAFNPRAN